MNKIMIALFLPFFAANGLNVPESDKTYFIEAQVGENQSKKEKVVTKVDFYTHSAIYLDISHASEIDIYTNKEENEEKKIQTIIKK